MKQKLYVVEGTHDETLLKQIDTNIKTISVGGSQLKPDVLDFIIAYQDKFQIVLLFDPDYTGEQIRKRVAKHLKNPTHLFVEKRIAYSKNRKKIGVEHLTKHALKALLAHEIKECYTDNQITLDTLYKLGLTGQKDSKLKRDYLTEKLNLGYSNAKILIDRLNWIGMTYKEIEEVLNASS